MLRVTSKLMCTMICGAALWGCVVVLFASSRLNINVQFTKDVNTDCQFNDDIDKPIERMSRETFGKLTNHLSKYANQIFMQSGDSSLGSMCTMVMLTYKRERTLSFLLNHYCRVKSLHKIIVIWNNVNKSIPLDILDIRDKCTTDLQFIREKENKLTNRFKPRPEIETECELYHFNVNIVLHS